MSEGVWRSPVDLPRDGTPILVLHRDYGRNGRAKSPTVWRVEALMLGQCEGKDGAVEYDWYSAGAWDCCYDSAKAMDRHIVGWAPMPLIPGFAP